MLIRRDSIIHRILAAVPLCISPYLLLPARVGLDCETFCTVAPRRFR